MILSTSHSYHTDPSRVVIHPSGFVPFGAPGKPITREITAVPAHDADTLTSAQCDDVTAAQAAHLHGGRLLTYDECDEFAAMVDAGLALQLTPVTLPNQDQLRSMPRQPGETDRAYQTRIRFDMSSLEWLRLHDDLCWRQLLAMQWQTLWPKAVLNFGKYHIQGDNDGTAHIRGWRRADKTWIQAGQRHGKGPHATRACRDYGTKFHIVRNIA